MAVSRKNTFLITLYIFSALGLVGLIIEGLFNVDIGSFLSFVSFIAMGVGLIGLSNIVGIRKYLDDGKLDGDEFTSIIVASIGFLVLVSAVFQFFSIGIISATTSRVIQGIAAFFLLAITTFQFITSLKRT